MLPHRPANTDFPDTHPPRASHRLPSFLHLLAQAKAAAVLTLLAAGIGLAQATPTVTLTSPGDGWSYNAPANLTLAAAVAVDPNDAGATLVRVEFYANGVLLGSDATSGYRFTWSGVPIGSHILTAKVIDSLGQETLSAPRTLTITDSSTNQAPTVNLTAPANNAKYALPADIVISANAADIEKNGSIASVELLANGQLLATLSQKPYSFTWSNPPAGTYTLTARATDNLGAQTESTPRTLTVLGSNAPPTVSLGGVTNNARYLLPVDLALTASASGGETNTPVVQVEFLANDAPLVATATKPYRFTWNNPPPGTYTLAARATDNQGLSTTSTARAIVVADTNTPPTVNLTAPANNAKYVLPVDLVISANATDAEINDGVSRVDFFANGALLGSASAKPYSLTWSNPPEGTHVLTARATDAHGGQTDSAVRTITISADNAAPRTSLSSPANKASFVSPVDIPLVASASGPETNTPVVLVEFLANGQLLGSATAKPYTLIWANAPVGTHVLTVRATDSLGSVNTSAARTITVTANQLPQVSLVTPTAEQKYTAPAEIALGVSAADSDGTIAQVAYFQNGNPVATVTTAPFGFTWTTVPAGTYTLTAQATDDKGGMTTSAPVTVTVQTPGAVPGIYFIYPDHLGTPRLVTDAQQNPVWRWDNAEPFGNNPPNEDPNGNGTRFAFDLRFPGQYFDRESNLHYNYFRDYDPSTGRYVQSDPIGLQGGINTYGYVGNNPLMWIDPLGLDWFKPPSGPPSIFPPGSNLPYAPQQNYCVTAECAAGLPPAPQDNRTIGQIDRALCEFVCNLVSPGPPIPLSFKGAVQSTTSGLVCKWICKDPQRQKCLRGQ